MTIDTTKLRELAQKATPGPWTQWNGHGWVSAGIPESNTKGSMIGAGGQICETECDDFSDAQNRRNAAYIAAANPATMLQLLDALDKEKSSFVALANLIFDIAEDVGVSKDSDGMIGHGAIADAIFKLNQIKSAALNLANVKGRHHSEQAMNQLLEALK